MAGNADILLEPVVSVYGVGVIDWRQSRVVAGAIVALFFAVQLTIPIARLPEERGQRFGWQMYSRSVRSIPEFVVTTSEGNMTVDLDDWLPTSRIEVNITVYLPSHLCRVTPGAETVSWEGGSHEC